MSIQTVGRYEIIGELGRGAMGVVYKAQDPTIGRTVALKTMRLDVHGLETEDVLRRFKNEARAAGLLNHPNIVTIYDAGEQDGMFYIAMEFIEGTTLQQILVDKHILPPEEVIQICRDVGRALDYAHANGIIHRDIKPANIMITPGGTVKIMDFGIAKAGGGMTSTGQVLGTPNYMSPEQVKGKLLDGRSDLFSFGVVLYEMITGEKPFVGQNVTTIIYKIVHENPTAPRDLDVSIHPGMSLVVTKALAKLPDERYQSGSELSQDMENYKSVGSSLNPTAVLP
ncbi:MAG TPA: serine/threonine-protein kinase, partial [Candidatus Angelobacter sp.]